MSEFKLGPIEGVIIREIKKYKDSRGWLAELFRDDELEGWLQPVMTYASITFPGVQRGPHEHVDQADYFCFFGPSIFRIALWDNRPDSPTYWNKMIEEVGEPRPTIVIVPKGVVHTYKNVGNVDGLVINSPNQLYAGKNKKEPIDEIRHEDDPNTIFKLD